MQLLEEEKIESLMIEDYKIIQSDKLYRFTSDAIYLSRFCNVKPNESVVDICSGSGIVGLHLFALNHQNIKSVCLVEIQEDLAEMSKKSIELNGLSSIFEVKNMPLQNLDSSLYAKFSLMTCNPPYKKNQSGFVSKNDKLAICKHEISVNVDDIARCASRLLKRGGRIALCNKCERLVDVILAFEKYKLSPSRIRFISGAVGQKPYLFFIEAYNGIKKQLQVEEMQINSSKDFSGN